MQEAFESYAYRVSIKRNYEKLVMRLDIRTSALPLRNSEIFRKSTMSHFATHSANRLRYLLGKVFHDKCRVNGFLQEALAGKTVEFPLPPQATTEIVIALRTNG
jgi:hypothetical protein